MKLKPQTSSVTFGDASGNRSDERGEGETAYLLKSEKMKRRLLEAIERETGVSLEVAGEKLGIERHSSNSQF